MTDPNELVSQIRARVAEQREDILTFLRDLIAIPSYDSQILEVGKLAEAEMKKLGFDDVWWDRMGNVVGVIGNGEKKLLYDGHLDTVGVDDYEAVDFDPFVGKVEDGILFARGACDEKGSVPGMIYGLAIAKELGLLGGYTAYYYANMEEWNEGSAQQVLCELEGIKPDFVVIGEPTDMRVYRGQKGRVEFEITAKGRSAHGASNHLGDNAIYKLVPIIEAISTMQAEFNDDPFLGKGTITVTDMTVKTVSVNAVPHEATIYVDRRLTHGETWEGELKRMQALIGERDDITIRVPLYDVPSYNGFSFPLEKIYPTWVTDVDHPLIQASLKTGEVLWGAMDAPHKWDFSTNGVYWAGKAGIPCVGFGPGDDQNAHTTRDQVKLDDVVRATEWFALLPAILTTL